MIYSLDIFDTLIIRDESPIETLSRLPEWFREKRIELHKNNYPVSIESFYDNLNENIEQELELEVEHLAANESMLSFIEKHKEDRFILVSDMYLSSDHLIFMLDKLNVPRFYEKIYVSSEHGASKEHFGKLFEIVAADYGRDVLHIGDNIKSDFLYPIMRFGSALHYVKEFQPYTPNYSSLEAYYRNYVDGILAPLMHLSIKKIQNIVANNTINDLIIVGSVFDFYRELLQPYFPNLPIKKLEISRYNLQFLMFRHIAKDKFVKLPHTESFLRNYYPDAFANLTDHASIFEKWKFMSEIIDTHEEDLIQKATETEASLIDQLRSKSISTSGNLFIDFGYQGSFCDFIDGHPLFSNKGNQVFLTVKEKNPIHKCITGIDITPFKMPVKGIRDPFWILDSEIILKKGNSTPLAFKGLHKNSEGWPEMYAYLLEQTHNYQTQITPYQLERELAYKVFKHICLIDDQFIAIFNQLSKHVRYCKYSLANERSGIVSIDDGFCQVNLSKVVEFEITEYGESEIYNIKNTPDFDKYDKKTPFFQYYRYLESIFKCKTLYI